MLILTISHHIYLTRDERYSLFGGKPVKTIGVSIPVWAEQGMTSEPAQEVFCAYELTNGGGERIVNPTSDGYKVIIPLKTDYMLPTLTDEEWRKLDKEEQNLWYERRVIPISAKNLLDYKDGGSEYLRFRYKTNYSTKNKQPTFHFIEIKKIEDLLDTIVT